MRPFWTLSQRFGAFRVGIGGLLQGGRQDRPEPGPGDRPARPLARLRRRNRLREVVADVKTIGSGADARVVEVAGVEVVGDVPTGRVLHYRINPGPDVLARLRRQGVDTVHGLPLDVLRSAPSFEAIADQLLAFIGDAALVIANAGHGFAYLNVELFLAGRPQVPGVQVVDPVREAARCLEGAPDGLDGLAERYGVDPAYGQAHTALTDAQIWAAIYAAMRNEAPEVGRAEVGGRFRARHVRSGGAATPRRTQARVLAVLVVVIVATMLAAAL